MIKMQEIKEKKAAELRSLLVELSANIREHRFGTAVQQERNVTKRSAMKKTIARIKTQLRQRKDIAKEV